MLVAGKGFHIILWPVETMQGAKWQHDEIHGFIDQKQKGNVRHQWQDLNFWLNLYCLPHYYWFDFEGEQASVAKWKMESFNDSFYCFLLILNIKQIITNHSQLDGLSSTAQATPGVDKLKDFQKRHQSDWTAADTRRFYCT